MAFNVERLAQISKAETRSIIGLMSGTSLDGLDVAHCIFENTGPETKVKLVNFKTVDYSQSEKTELRKLASVKTVDLEHLCDVNTWIAQLHGKIVLDCLDEWGLISRDIDLIGSHGQTVYHSPKSSLSLQSMFPNSTLQIGDGDHLAMATGIITIADFRQKHVAAGGEGAPLALYGDYFLFSMKGENRIMLNIGGISNITCLYGDMDCSKAFATDLGPGNTLIDAVMRKYFDKEFDEGSKIAFSGAVNEELLSGLLNHPFLNRSFPKTTGPEMFNLEFVENVRSGMKHLISNQDVVATVTKLTALVIIKSMKAFFEEDIKTFNIYVSGGGAHNPKVMQDLKEYFGKNLMGSTDLLGITGDAKEAVLFAILANEAVSGDPSVYNFGVNSNTKKMPTVAMGKVCFPS